MKKVTEKVEKLLKDYPECRSSDKRLWITYLVVYHNLRMDMRNKPDLAFETFVLTMMDKATPSFESISRSRRKFQEKGMYLPSEQIAKARKQRQDDIKVWSLAS